jgi:PhnB protein
VARPDFGGQEEHTTKSAHPYLNFKGNTKEAFAFYRSVFGGEFEAVIRYRDFGNGCRGMADHELDKVAHIALPLGPDAWLMGTDVVDPMPMPLTQGNNFSIALEPESADEAERLFFALSAGGKAEMPLQRTGWAEKFGCCVDRFGVRWMVSYAGTVEFAPSGAA